MRITTPIALALIIGHSPATAADVKDQSGALAPLAVPTAVGPSAMPRITNSDDGQLTLSWLEMPSIPNSGATRLVFSRLVNQQWSKRRVVASGSDWFVNWADFPSVLSLSSQQLAAHWLVKSGQSTYAYDVAVSQTLDDGLTWMDPVIVHRDDTRTEHGFATLFAARGGFGVVWLDGRSTGGGGPMTLRATTVAGNRPAETSTLIDGAVCDCCQTDVAMAESGPVVAYRNRTSDEIRDIYVSRSHHGRWQTPQPVFADNWRIAGCPVNGPSIAAQGNHIAVAWFTMAEDRAKVSLAYSADGGDSFQAPIILDDKDPLGRVDLVLLDDATAMVTWLRTVDNATAQFVVRRVGPRDPIGEPLIIASVPHNRLSGFPQIERSGNQLIFAWTTTEDRQLRVRSAVMPIGALPAPEQVTLD